MSPALALSNLQFRSARTNVLVLAACSVMLPLFGWLLSGGPGKGDSAQWLGMLFVEALLIAGLSSTITLAMSPLEEAALRARPFFAAAPISSSSLVNGVCLVTFGLSLFFGLLMDLSFNVAMSLQHQRQSWVGSALVTTRATVAVAAIVCLGLWARYYLGKRSFMRNGGFIVGLLLCAGAVLVRLEVAPSLLRALAAYMLAPQLSSKDLVMLGLCGVVYGVGQSVADWLLGRREA